MWLEGNNPFAVMLATVVGIPMYADIFGTSSNSPKRYFAKGVDVGV